MSSPLDMTLATDREARRSPISNHVPQNELVRKRRILGGFLGLTFATLAVVDVALYTCMASQGSNWPDWVTALAAGTTLGQVALISAAIVWTPVSLLKRVLGGTLLCLALGVLGATTEGKASLAAWMGGLCLYAIMPAAAFQAARWIGRELRFDSSDSEQLQPSQSSLRPNQFSVWTLLAVMTTTAILLAAARHVDFPLFNMLERWRRFVLMTGVAVVAWCVVMGPEFRSRLQISLAMLGLILFAAFTGSFMSFDFPQQEGSLGPPLAMLANAATVAGVAIVLRVAGLRLSRTQA